MAWDFDSGIRRFNNPQESGFGQGRGGGFGSQGQGFGNISNTGTQAGGFYKEPNMMQRIFDSLSKNRQNIMDTRDRYAGAGSLSGVIGGGGGARGSVVNNTPGIVQLLSLLANRNRQF